MPGKSTTPEDMSTVWVRDENHDIRGRLKQGARLKGQKVADYLRCIIENALNDDNASNLAPCGGENRQSGRQD